jgi:hypothetical protein
MPPAGAISIIALGMLRRDGVRVLTEVAIGLASIALVWGVVASFLIGWLQFIQHVVI